MFLRNVFLAPFNAYHFPLIAGGLVGLTTYMAQKYFVPSSLHKTSYFQYLSLVTSVLTCLIGYRTLLRIIPTRDIGAEVHFHGDFNVAVKDFDLSTSSNHPTFYCSKTGKQLRVPGAAIYYPTASKIDDNDRSRWPSWCPFDDREYAYGFSNYVPLPRFMFGHYITAKIRAMNANDPGQESTIELPRNFETELGTNKFPVVLFSHGLAGHSRAYTTFACELASRGAVVICPTFTDGSAVYARTHAEKALWPGPAHEEESPARAQMSKDNELKKRQRSQSTTSSSKNNTEEEKSFEVIYVKPPPEGGEEEQRARNDFRMRQIKHRVMELEEWQAAIECGDALEWIFGKTKTFSSSTTKKNGEKQHQQQQLKNVAQKLHSEERQIRMIGHSFGAASAMIVATEKCLVSSKPIIDEKKRNNKKTQAVTTTATSSSIAPNPPSRKLPTVVLLDLWWLLPELRFGMQSGVFAGKVPTSQKAGIRTEASRNNSEYVDPTFLPDIELIDSAQWQWDQHDSRAYRNFLAEEWPSKFSEEGIKKTDHIAVSDLGIFSPVISRISQIVKYDEFTAEEVPAIQAKVTWKALVSGDKSK